MKRLLLGILLFGAMTASAADPEVCSDAYPGDVHGQTACVLRWTAVMVEQLSKLKDCKVDMVLNVYTYHITGTMTTTLHNCGKVHK